MDASKIALARALIAARDALLEAEGEASRRREIFHKAEAAFCSHVSEQIIPVGRAPMNPVVDGVAILLADEWYDAKPGSRVQFHTVEVVS